MPQILIILGPPRSFTTVVSAMLGQHPQMYGLPEMHLLSAETMAEWWNQCAQATFNMDHGVVRVVAELYFGNQTERSVKRASGRLRRRSHFSTGMIVEMLAEKVYPRILVDKSPSIIYRLEFLQHAYRMFPQARFIHLVRHPRGHGESVMKYLRERKKLGPVPPEHWLLYLASFPDQSLGEHETSQGTLDLDPQRGWYALHRNICEFLQSVPDEQKRRIRGEDVLRDPDRQLRELAAWMKLRTDDEAIEEMKHPERSPYACFGPPSARFGNDRFFLQDPVLRPSRAALQSLEGPLRWRGDGRGFLPRVKQLAKEFGYE